MRPLPSLLLYAGAMAGTAIEYGLSSGQYLDYCIAEADTTIDMTALTAMAAPDVCAAMDKSCTLYASHHLGAWHVRAQPQSSRKI